MRKLLATLMVLLFLASTILMFPVKAQAAPGCVIDVLGIRVCGTLVGQPLPEVVEVTVTPAPRVIRVPVPGPTVTVTPQPGSDATVTVPGPTKTVTVAPRAQSGNENSVQPVRPRATRTVTATPQPSALPSPTPDRPSVKRPEKLDEPDAVDFGDGDTTPQEVGVGLAAILGVVALILLALYGGYVLGYKDAERKETGFMRALLEQASFKRK